MSRNAGGSIRSSILETGTKPLGEELTEEEEEPLLRTQKEKQRRKERAAGETAPEEDLESSRSKVLRLTKEKESRSPLALTAGGSMTRKIVGTGPEDRAALPGRSQKGPPELLTPRSWKS